MTVTWNGPECVGCGGTGVAVFNPAPPAAQYSARCPACNGHGREPSEKLPGKTLAESLGIDVPDNAPGGHRVADPTPASAQRSTRGRHLMTDAEYDGWANR